MQRQIDGISQLNFFLIVGSLLRSLFHMKVEGVTHTQALLSTSYAIMTGTCCKYQFTGYNRIASIEERTLSVFVILINFRAEAGSSIYPLTQFLISTVIETIKKMIEYRTHITNGSVNNSCVYYYIETSRNDDRRLAM